MMVKIYAVALLAFRHTDEQCTECRAVASALEAEVDEQAHDRAMEMALTTYPISEQWFDHQVRVVAVPEEWIADRARDMFPRYLGVRFD